MKFFRLRRYVFRDQVSRVEAYESDQYNLYFVPDLQYLNIFKHILANSPPAYTEVSLDTLFFPSNYSLLTFSTLTLQIFSLIFPLSQLLSLEFSESPIYKYINIQMQGSRINEDSTNLSKYNKETQSFRFAANRFHPSNYKLINYNLPAFLKQNSAQITEHKFIVIYDTLALCLLPSENSGKAKIAKIHLETLEVEVLKNHEKRDIQLPFFTFFAVAYQHNIATLISLEEVLRVYELHFSKEFSEHKLIQINMKETTILNENIQMLIFATFNDNDSASEKFVFMARNSYHQPIMKIIEIVRSEKNGQLCYRDGSADYTVRGSIPSVNIESVLLQEIAREFQKWSYCIINSKIYFFSVNLNAITGQIPGKLFEVTLSYNENHWETSLEAIQLPRVEQQEKFIVNFGIEKIGDDNILLILKELPKVAPENIQKCSTDLTLLSYQLSSSKWFQPITIESYHSYNRMSLMGKIGVRYCPTNLIYILNGLENIHCIQFMHEKIFDTEICGACIKRMNNNQRYESTNKKSPFASNCLFYNISQEIQCPFSAFALLADCAQALNSTNFSVQLTTNLSYNNYLAIKFNGDELSDEQYGSIISHSYKNDSKVLSVIDKIKLGAFRLGKTFLYVNTYARNTPNQLVRVFFFSADGTIMSHYEELYSYMAYEQTKSTNMIRTHEGVHHKAYIKNYLNSIFTDSETLIKSVQDHALFILDINIVMNSEKQYYSQIVLSSLYLQRREGEETSDIGQIKDIKQVAFLEKAGYTLNNNIQVSLLSFMKHFHNWQQFDSISIQSQNYTPEKSEDHNGFYINTLRKLINSGSAVLLQQKHSYHISDILIADLFICEITKQTFVTENQGLLLYYKGRLINRYPCRLGSLMWQNFYKKKYRAKEGTNLWKYAGVIDIKQGLQPKMLWTDFKKSVSKHIFDDYLDSELFRPEKQLQMKQKESDEDEIDSNIIYLLADRQQEQLQAQQGPISGRKADHSRELRSRKQEKGDELYEEQQCVRRISGRKRIKINPSDLD